MKSFKTYRKIILSLLFITFIFGQKIDNLPVVDWSKNLNIYELNIRQYSKEGTFAAVEKDLPRLKKLGVGIIWLMPINPIGVENRKGTLGSYYAVKDYNALNPEFGDEKSFKSLVTKIHKLGMKVIVDWVANHTSPDNVWVKQFPEFYMRNPDGKLISPVEDWTDVADLNYDNKKVWEEMIKSMSYWVKEFDIDGYRCDVAGMVPIQFWQQVRIALDKIKPVFMLAEANEAFHHNRAFDMTYNWPLKDMMNSVAKGEKKAKDIKDLFLKEFDEYGDKSIRMLFTTNHDENSWNGTEFERLGNGAEVFSAFCATAKGMFLLYNGQEAGLNRRLLFFEKDPITWKKHKFFDLYAKLNQLKKDNPALWNPGFGGTMDFIDQKNDDVLVFTRKKDNNEILCIFNLSPNVQKTELQVSGNYTCFSSGKKAELKAGSYELKPWEYRILIKKN